MSEEEDPEYVGKFEVESTLIEQTRVVVSMEDQATIMVDEPADFIVGDPPLLSGFSRGWTPVHLQHAGLASCTTITVTVVAKTEGYAIDSVRLIMRSKIDARGFLDDFDRQPEFMQIDLDFFVTTNEPIERLRQLAHEVDRRCPQMGLFHRAGVPMIQRWFHEGADEPSLELKYRM